MSSDFLIDLPLRRDWACVEQLRESALVCLATVTSDSDFREQLAMVVGELLENAVKYGEWSRDTDIARLRIHGSAHRVEVSVTHRISSQANLAALEAELERIRKAENAEQAYVERMLAVAQRKEGIGGLGLARVAFEGNCSLTAEREGEALLRIRAVTTPPESRRMMHPH